MTIRASQVLPVYPLSEDLQPGDVFLVQMPIDKQHVQYQEQGFLPLDNHIKRLNPSGYKEFYANVSVAEIATDGRVAKWHDATPLPFARGGLAAVTTGRSIVVSGGQVDSVGNLRGLKRITDVAIASIRDDGTLGPWRAGPPLPRPRFHHPMVYHNGWIYSVGGQGEKEAEAGIHAARVNEQREIGAELAVIVTAAMPKDAREPFLREADVWVARFDAARPLAEALRAMLVEVHRQREANLGRAEKAELLYNYLCSPQFAQRLKSVYHGFAAMREELEAEKAAYARIWKKREAQLTRMQDGLLGVVGDLQGIGQDAFPELDGVAALPAVALEPVVPA